MKPLRPLLRRLLEDDDFRLKVAFSVAGPIYIGLIVAVLWWGISSGTSGPSEAQSSPEPWCVQG
jgi:hypothetical protein